MRVRVGIEAARAGGRWVSALLLRGVERSLDDGLPLGSEGVGKSLMVRSSLYIAHLPGTVLEQMMAKLVQQYVKSHEVSQPCRLVCRLFVEEDLARCSGLAVDHQSGVEVLGLSQLDDS